MTSSINDTSAARKALAENRSMQSEIGSWIIDLTFCARMLEIYGLKAEDGDIKSRIRESRKLVEGFIGERLDRISAELKSREQHLIKLSEDALLLRDREMPYQQNSDIDLVDDARKSFNELQRVIYSLIEELKSL